MKRILILPVLGMLLLGIAIPVFAERTPRKVDLTCMRTVVGKREDSIVAAKEKAFASLDAAFKARRDSLKSAWDKSDATERRAAINAAWKAFRDSHKAARAQLRTDDKAAWSMFKTDRKACKVDGASTNTDGAGEKIDAATL